MDEIEYLKTYINNLRADINEFNTKKRSSIDESEKNKIAAYLELNYAKIEMIELKIEIKKIKLNIVKERDETKIREFMSYMDKIEVKIDKIEAIKDKIETKIENIEMKQNEERNRLSKKAKLELDITDSILSKYESSAGINGTTTVDRIKEIVNSGLTHPIPLPSGFAKYISKTTKSFEKMIEITDDKYVDIPFRFIFEAAILNQIFSMSGENSLIYYLDSLVKNPLSYLSNFLKKPFDFGRNVSDKQGKNSTMSINKKRPDFLVWNSKSILVFRGEEKETKNAMHEAKDDLVSKCGSMSEIFFGQIPYVFCYAAAGNNVQFFVINREKQLIPLHSTEFNLGCVESRVEIVIMALNIAWCLRDYEMMENSAIFPFNCWIKRNNGVEIFFGSDFVKKRILSDNYQLADLNILKKIYEAIIKGDIVNTIKCEEIKTKPFQIKLTPICYPFGIYKIDSNEKLLIALKSVVAALVGLHSKGIVHRDIRWENVLFDSENYLLTDFECAGKVDIVLPKDLRKYGNIQYPEIFKDKNTKYTKQVDLYLVGKLIEYIQLKGDFKINQKILDLIVPVDSQNLNLYDFNDTNLTAKNVLACLEKITLA